MTFLMFVCALALSASAAWYSIVGLTAIFAAAKIPIIIMGTTLEVSKLVVASWLYRNWRTVPFLMKSYLTGALLVLMFLTSMGIFGFLSKGHGDQSMNSGEVLAQIELIEQKIQIENAKIDSAKASLIQLDSQVNEMIGRSKSTAAINRSITIRKRQDQERSMLAETIETAQSNISELNNELFPIKSKNRELEAEVGPIKYIAALIYGDSVDENLLERAIRWVIILIVAVFDPLAVIMLIAANWSLRNRSKDEDPKIGPEMVPQDLPKSNQESFIEFPQRTIITTDVKPVQSNSLGLLIQEPQLEPNVTEIVMNSVTNAEEAIEEEDTDAIIDVTEELVQSTETQPIESNQSAKDPEPETTARNAPETTEDFWRSRPHRPINRV